MAATRSTGRATSLWNFVSSSRARLARPATTGRPARFPPVPGDDGELVPFPD
ncbi:MAG: hypothetical protein HS111_30530 [Kofleriaceae bacterium]|nr:hypothetical protein [Kofleriaceae bacterium]